MHTLTRINPGLSRDEKYERYLRARIRRNPGYAYQIAVLGTKGGVGRTTVTATLGSVFAEARRDRILAVDVDHGAGDLADRVGRRSAATIADLLVDKDSSQYSSVKAHTSANAVNLEVIAAEGYSTAARAFTPKDWHHAADAVSRFYTVVLADCGAGLFDPVTRAVLSTVSAVVIVTSASVDGVRQTEAAIDWLRLNGHRDLLNYTCVVVNQAVPKKQLNVAVPDLARQIQQHVRPGRVVVLPRDKHIAAEETIEFDRLDPGYRRKITELAAVLSDDFDQG